MALSTKTLDALNDSRKTEPHKYIWGQFTPDKEGTGYSDLPEQTNIPDDAKLVLDVNGPSLVTASVKDLKNGISGSIATTEKAGIVKPDGTTISVSSDGTISAEFTGALAGKANTDLSNVPANIDYVVESYSDSIGNWYRVYKSGWLEQGGTFAVTKEVREYRLLKPYKDAYYVILITPLYKNITGYVQEQTDTSMKIATSETGIFAWEAKGMSK